MVDLKSAERHVATRQEVTVNARMTVPEKSSELTMQVTHGKGWPGKTRGAIARPNGFIRAEVCLEFSFLGLFSFFQKKENNKHRMKDACYFVDIR